MQYTQIAQTCHSLKLLTVKSYMHVSCFHDVFNYVGACGKTRLRNRITLCIYSSIHNHQVMAGAIGKAGKAMTVPVLIPEKSGGRFKHNYTTSLPGWTALRWGQLSPSSSHDQQADLTYLALHM